MSLDPPGPPQPDAAQPPLMRPLRFGETIDIGVKLMLRNAGQLMLATALIVVPLSIIAALVQVSIDPTAFDPVDFGELNSPTGGADADVETQIAGALVTSLITAIGSQFAVAICFAAVNSALTGAKPSAMQSVRAVGRRAHSALWVILLVLGLWLVPFGIGVGTTAALWPAGMLIGLALVPVCVAAYVFATVSLPALLVEDRRGTKALRRSFGLVRGRFWPTFGMLIVAQLLMAFVVQLVPSVVLMLVLFTVDSSAVIAVTSVAITALINALVLPFTAAIIALIYFDLRVRKEGYDVQLMAERMAFGPAAQPAPFPDFATGPKQPVPMPAPPPPSYGGFSPPTPGQAPPPPPPSFSPPPSGYGWRDE